MHVPFDFQSLHAFYRGGGTAREIVAAARGKIAARKRTSSRKRSKRLQHDLQIFETDPVTPNARLGTYTNFVNLLDLSAIAIPGPFRSDGMPAGLTLIGERGADAALAQVAARFFSGRGGLLAQEGMASP